MEDGPWRRARHDSPTIIMIIMIMMMIIITIIRIRIRITISEVGTSGRRPLAPGKA